MSTVSHVNLATKVREGRSLTLHYVQGSLVRYRNDGIMITLPSRASKEVMRLKLSYKVSSPSMRNVRHYRQVRPVGHARRRVPNIDRSGYLVIQVCVAVVGYSFIVSSSRDGNGRIGAIVHSFEGYLIQTRSQILLIEPSVVRIELKLQNIFTTTADDANRSSQLKSSNPVIDMSRSYVTRHLAIDRNEGTTTVRPSGVLKVRSKLYCLALLQSLQQNVRNTTTIEADGRSQIEGPNRAIESGDTCHPSNHSFIVIS